MSIDISDIFEGRAAQITAIADDRRTVFYRYAAGPVGTLVFTVDDPTPLKVGDVVIIDGNQLRIADKSIWNEPLRVGVVRRVYPDRTLVESGSELRFVTGAPGTDVRIGATVTFGEFEGIREVVEETPIRVHLAGGDEDDPVAKYRRSKSDPKLGYEDFGGYSDIVSLARKLIETPLQRAEELRKINARPIRGVMLTGPPGTGKTHLARIIADQSDAVFYSVSGPQIASKWVGDSEENLRRIFEDASKQDRSIIFFDEIDSLAEKRTDQSQEYSRRLVGQFLTLMDGIDSERSNTIVIAATNQPDHIDPALRRPGRFDREIHFGIPKLEDRLDILLVSMRRIAIDENSYLPLEELALETEGWSAAQLTALWTEAALLAAIDRRDALHEEDLFGALERLKARTPSSSGGSI
ncbi:ATP-binding protein [Nocardia nova]